MLRKRQTNLQTISKYETTESKEFPMWIEQGMDQGIPTIYDNIISWISNPRRTLRKGSKTMKNLKVVVSKFSDILQQFTPDDLLIDSQFELFILDIKDMLYNTNLANKTIDSYLQIFCSQILVHGKASQSLISDIKSDITFIRKGMGLKQSNEIEISDQDIEKWLATLDTLCESPQSSPNLSIIANPNSPMKNSKHTSLRLLLAVRAYGWLSLITAGRANEVRRIKIEDINQNKVTRYISKMKIYAEPVTTDIREDAWKRISPYLDYVAEHYPNAELLFSESEARMGLGTISPKTLRELVKGSMIHSGMGPTCEGGYYRTHDLRKVWSRWLQSNGGTLDDARIMLGHRSADTTAKHYVGNSQTESQRAMAEQIGHKHLQDLLQIRDELKNKLEDLEKLFGELPHFTVHDNGSLTWPYMDGDDDQLMYIPDEIDTSGLLSKSGIKPQISNLSYIR